MSEVGWKGIQTPDTSYVFCYGLHLSSLVYNSVAVLYTPLHNQRSLSMPDLNFSTTFFPALCKYTCYTFSRAGLGVMAMDEGKR